MNNEEMRVKLRRITLRALQLEKTFKELELKINWQLLKKAA